MSSSDRKRPERGREDTQGHRFRRSHPEFQCPIEFRNATPPLSLGPYLFDIPVHLDDGKRPPRPDALNYDACSYRLTEMEANYQFALPPIDKLFFTTCNFFDFVDEVEDWQPEGDKACVPDLAPFLVSIEDLKLNDGGMPPNAPKVLPLPFIPKEETKTVALERPVERATVTPQASRGRTSARLPQTGGELARAVEGTFGAKDFVHPYKPGLRIRRSTPILPARSLPSIAAHFVVDQEVAQGSLVKAMTSPSDPSETFIWLYARTEVDGDDRQQVYQLQRDFTVQRNVKTDNLLVLYYPRMEGEAELGSITNQYSLRRNRGRVSDSLRRVRPRLAVERTGDPQ